MGEKEIYILLAGIGTFFFVGKLLLVSFGFEGDHDLDVDLDGSESFELISFQAFFALLMGVGWSALAFRYELGLSGVAAVFYSSLFGFATMFLSSWLMFQVKKLAWTPTEKVPKKGSIGRAYTNISKNSGEIQVSVGGKLSMVKAISEHENIEAFSSVEIVRVESENLVVVKSMV